MSDETRLFCPLHRVPFTNAQGRDDAKMYYCLKEKCAWWCTSAECCSVVLKAGMGAGALIQ